MIHPLYLLLLPLFIGFLLPLFHRMGRKVAISVFHFTILLSTFGHLMNFVRLYFHSAQALVFDTAGFPAPISIQLQYGKIESFLLAFITIIVLFSANLLQKHWFKNQKAGMTLYLVQYLGMSGLILTQDLFNFFVFLEIYSISSIVLIALERKRKQLQAGFNYMLASGLASSFLLIGIGLVYYQTGQLNFSAIAENSGMILNNIGITGIFFVVLALVIELKPYPINGWGIDVYEHANSKILSIISTGGSAAVLYGLLKILPSVPDYFMKFFAGVFLISFLFSHWTALKENNAKRILGMSSSALMSLLGLILFLTKGYNFDLKFILPIIAGFLVSHFLAKAGLFWIAGQLKQKEWKDWTILKNHPGMLASFILFCLALIGFPPFPAFWMKWNFLQLLFSYNLHGFAYVILVGSLLEAVYLGRWMTVVLTGEKSTEKQETSLSFETMAFSILLLGAGLFFAQKTSNEDILMLYPVLGFLTMLVADKFNRFIKLAMSFMITGSFGYLIWNQLHGLELFFAILFLSGSALQLIPAVHYKENRVGYFALATMLTLSLANLVVAKSTLSFFTAWEFMTLSSFFLFARRASNYKYIFQYLIFSLAGAFCILIGLQTSGLSLFVGSFLENAFGLQIPVFSAWFMAIGFLIKIASLGSHIWISESYADADDDFTAIASSVLSKAGVMGLFILAIASINYIKSYENYHLILGWIGTFTAFFGALMAVFQEDIKKLLAYSSMSQVGYITLAIASMSHIGFVSAIYLTLNHFIFKALIFIAIAGVIHRVGTRNMYEMGGLIKKMPISFISVLMGIIAVSGVPPLSGFGSKWLLYNTLIEKGWYLQSGIAFFSSAIAFLYLFRLIHSIFLGQPKIEHKDVKETSIWMIIPQGILMMLLMAFSMKPIWFVKPMSAMIQGYLPVDFVWEGETMINSLGYWNGSMVMYVTMGVFIMPLVWLMFIQRKPQKVEQFNIVFSAERPLRPETTHVAHNMYASYQKALGFIIQPKLVRNWWQYFAEAMHTFSRLFQSFYTGNGQSYLLQILLYLIVLFYILGGNL